MEKRRQKYLTKFMYIFYFNNVLYLFIHYSLPFILPQIMTYTSEQMPTSAETIQSFTASRSKRISMTAWVWMVSYDCGERQLSYNHTITISFQHPISLDRLHSATSCTSSSAKQLSSLSTAAKYVIWIMILIKSRPRMDSLHLISFWFIAGCLQSGGESLQVGQGRTAPLPQSVDDVLEVATQLLHSRGISVLLQWNP